MRSTELSVRSDQVPLPPQAQAPTPVPLLQAEAEASAWRIIEVVGAGPFELELRWSAGTGTGAKARLTVARSTRVAVFARTLGMVVTNLTEKKNAVSVTVADGQAVTHNVFEHRGMGSGELQEVPIPPFSQAARLEVANALEQDASWLLIYDGQGLMRAMVPALGQPPEGTRLGCAARIEVQVPSETLYRVLFTLAL